MVENTLNPLPRSGINLLAEGVLDYVQTEDRKFIRFGFWENGENGFVFIFPGRAEYIEKYSDVIKKFLVRGYSVLCIDWRGQGLSQRPKGRRDIGHVKNFFEYQSDFDTVTNAISARIDQKKPKILFAHSMGCCIALRTLLRDNFFNAAVFSSPLWGLPISNFTLSVLIPFFNLLISLGFGYTRYPFNQTDGFYVLENSFENNLLTGNSEIYQKMRENLIIDPRLGLGPPTLNWLVTLNKEQKKLAKMPPPDIPQLVLLGSLDKIISEDAVLSRIARTPKGHCHIVRDALHEIFFDMPGNQEYAWQKVDQFLETNLSYTGG